MQIENTELYLLNNQHTWLVTGAAGFIGSNLVERLLQLNQVVIGLDNIATGKQGNLDDVKDNLDSKCWKRFSLTEGDILDFDLCKSLCSEVDYVLHQAALGSVPRSLADPLSTNSANVTGFLNMLTAAKEQKVQSFTYAASSSTYGDHPALPKVENIIGNPLSPYAVTKYVNELYAKVFSSAFGIKTTGLRYFNVFGKRQDPDGAYAAVIPKWVSGMIAQTDITINGDGSTSRDFCFIENVIQANILAALAQTNSGREIYNVAVGERTTLLELFNLIRDELRLKGIDYTREPCHVDFRTGDVLHSQANISKIETELGYIPVKRIAEGLREALPWYIRNLK